MQAFTAEGLKRNKTQLYRDLDLEHGPTPKAWESRMQNILHVLEQLKEERIERLKLAKNVGPEVTGVLIKLLKVAPHSAVAPATITRLEQQLQLVDESGYYLPDSVEDQRDCVLTSIVQRQGQRKLRAALIEAYGGKCTMAGCGVIDVLEAAHIHRYMGNGTNIVSNGCSSDPTCTHSLI